jgi:hypothetical protein
MIAAVIRPSIATKIINHRRNLAAAPRECLDGAIDAFGIFPAFSIFQTLFIDLVTAQALSARRIFFEKRKRSEPPGKIAMTGLKLRDVPEVTND